MLSEQSVRPQETDDGPVNPHPMGEKFEENGFIYEWDHTDEYYHFFIAGKDGEKGREFTEIEIVELGGDNYNKNLLYPTEHPASQEGG